MGQHRVRSALETGRDGVGPCEAGTLFIAMNDLLVEDVVVIPLIWRNDVVAVSQTLRGLELSTWDSNLWDLAHGYRQA
jgi:peptide/nickel transport system substrate-binding protein